MGDGLGLARLGRLGTPTAAPHPHGHRHGRARRRFKVPTFIYGVWTCVRVGVRAGLDGCMDAPWTPPAGARGCLGRTPRQSRRRSPSSGATNGTGGWTHITTCCTCFTKHPSPPKHIPSSPASTSCQTPAANAPNHAWPHSCATLGPRATASKLKHHSSSSYGTRLSRPWVGFAETDPCRHARPRLVRIGHRA